MTKKTTTPSLSAALKELEALVSYFDQEDFDLDEGMAKYDQASQLIEQVAQKIKGYELQIEEKRTHLATILED